MTNLNSSRPSATARRTILAWTLGAVVALAMLMGTGPGVLLVNRPQTIAGVPLVYAWGILWYLVMVVVALVAYGVFWRDDSDTASPAEPAAKASDK